MNPKTIKGPEIKNVSIDSKNATATYDPLGMYRGVIIYATVVKTSPTADANFKPTLSDAMGLISLNINDKAGKRLMTAQELNEIQTAWAANLAAVYYDKMDLNFNTVNDTTETDNGVASTVRTGTWVLRINFNEPSRDTYAAKQFFGIATLWKDNTGKQVATAKLQLQFVVPGPSTLTNYVALGAMATGKYNLKNPTWRCEIVVDEGVSGPFKGDTFGSDFIWVHTSATDYTTPICPLTHWYRINESYTNTTPTLLKNNQQLVGAMQQISFFSPNGSGDDVLTYQFKTNQTGQTVTKHDTSKISQDLLKLDNGWNPARIQSNSGDITGTTWTQVDVFHLAFDFNDDPNQAEPYPSGLTSEFDVILSQNTAANKTIICIAQLWRDALAS